MSTVVQINTYNGGSTGSIARRINAVAQKQGWQVFFYYGRKFLQKIDAPGDRIIGTGIWYKMSILWHVLQTRLFDRHGQGSKWATRLLIKNLKEIKPDIVHLHNVHGYYVNYKLLFDYLADANIPIVWTLHDCWAFTGHCAHFVSVGCMKWRDGGCNQCLLSRQYPKAYWDFSKRNFSHKRDAFVRIPSNLHIVTVSGWLRTFVNQSFLRDCNVDTIYNGVDLTIFHPEYLPINNFHVGVNEKVVLGVSAIWNKDKGLDDFKQLRKMLASNIKIILVGLNATQIQELPSGVIGVERMQNMSELAGLYAMADVFVNPTYADTFPTVNLESLACGTPVITYRTGGSPEAISPETGVVVEQGNLQSLCDAIDCVLQRGKDYYKENCRKRAEEFFDKDKCYQQYIDLYNNILNNK